jgi:glycosyltransferase involved in cell wall biosynthesis
VGRNLGALQDSRILTAAAEGRRSDPFAKALARAGYRTATGLRARLFARAPRRGDAPRVFYGGARAGDAGGPLVKVQRLQAAFPQPAGIFNLVYSLSNAPYLDRDTLAALKARGVGIVHNQNGVFYPGWYAGDWRAENKRMSHAYRLAHHVFWQSSFCRMCADRFLGERDGPGEVLFNAVDTGRFAPRPTKTGGPFTFLLTGKLQAHLAYRLEDSVAGLAAARASGLDAELHVAGILDAGARDALDSAARRHGIAPNVRILGAYTQADAPAIYNAADAYVMTKHADPCPNTVIEAMACGLPIVYVASGGVPELVGPDVGAGVDADDDWERPFRPDPDALGAAMVAVAAGRPAMSAAARIRAETAFTLDGWIARHRAVFAKVMGAQ